MIKTFKTPEILAPCGSYEILTAAVHAGADACYVGGFKFGARAYAENFDNDNILRAIEFAHLHGCKLYLTVNTLFKDNEINELYDYLCPFYENGLDAVIVQDLGAFSFIKKYFPDIKIHCSTQMNITSVHGAGLMKEQGAARIVTSREMSLDEIKKIKETVDIEIEAFVHGAMCYSYSGQCLMSSFAGKRSGNRGRCAQPCRKKYNGEYLLSMKDMCTVESIPLLVEAGIDSFKIEGRMKNEYYVASAVNAYRELVHDYVSGIYSEKKAAELKYKLANIYNRGGFCGGYFFSHNGEEMISRKRPNHQGVKIGRLLCAEAGKILFELTEELYKNDVLELELKDGTYVDITSNVSGHAGENISLNAPKTRDIAAGQDIYRTKSAYIEESLQDTHKKISLSGVFSGRVGEALSLEVSCIFDNRTYSGSSVLDIVAESQNTKPEKNVILDKLCQLGNTDYCFDKIDIFIDDNSFIPLGNLKKLRRAAIGELEKNIVNSYFRENKNDELHIKNIGFDKEFGKININPYDSINISVLTIDQLKTVVEYDSIKNIYIDFGLYNNSEVKNIITEHTGNGKRFFICLPDVIKNDFDISRYLPNDNISGIYIKNIDGLACVLKLDNELLSGLDLVCGPSLYTYNASALDFLTSLCKGLTFTLGLELNKKELETFTKNAASYNYNIVMYGHTRVMLSNQCIKKTKGKCDKKTGITRITDELGNTFYCHNECNGCYNKIYNRDALNIFERLNRQDLENLGVSGIFIDFTIENEAATRKVLDYALDFENRNKSLDFSATTGHLNRGVE